MTTDWNSIAADFRAVPAPVNGEPADKQPTPSQVLAALRGLRADMAAARDRAGRPGRRPGGRLRRLATWLDLRKRKTGR